MDIKIRTYLNLNNIQSIDYRLDDDNNNILEWNVPFSQPTQEQLNAITQEQINDFLLNTKINFFIESGQLQFMKALLKYVNPSIDVEDDVNIKEIFTYAATGKPKFNRTKQAINPIDETTQVSGVTLAGSVFSLDPLIYNYAQSANPNNPAFVRLLSTDVNDKLPAIVYKDKDNGNVETIDYKGLNVLLLYELKKMKARIDTLETQVATLQGFHV